LEYDEYVEICWNTAGCGAMLDVMKTFGLTAEDTTRFWHFAQNRSIGRVKPRLFKRCFRHFWKPRTVLAVLCQDPLRQGVHDWGHKIPFWKILPIVIWKSRLISFDELAAARQSTVQLSEGTASNSYMGSKVFSPPFFVRHYLDLRMKEKTYPSGSLSTRRQRWISRLFITEWASLHPAGTQNAEVKEENGKGKSQATEDILLKCTKDMAFRKCRISEGWLRYIGLVEDPMYWAWLRSNKVWRCYTAIQADSAGQEFRHKPELLDHAQAKVAGTQKWQIPPIMSIESCMKYISIK
jgi:hypothetical protein